MPIFALDRLFDPPARVEAREREHEATVRGVKQKDGAPPERARFRCRVCGYTAPDPAYCPDCLADTMVPVHA